VSWSKRARWRAWLYYTTTGSQEEADDLADKLAALRGAAPSQDEIERARLCAEARGS
jgi:hypothetical protein